MKRFLILGILALVGACSSTPAPKESYPYNMTDKEWNELSIKDKAAIRRDYYFFEKGNTNFVNPTLEIEGKKEPVPNVFMNRNNQQRTAAPNTNPNNQ